MMTAKYPSQINAKTVRLTPETHAALKSLAFEWQKSIGETVRILVQFAKEGELKPQTVLLRKQEK